MTKIVLADGTEEQVTPGTARAKVAAGEARYTQAIPEYSTRMMTASNAPIAPKLKRKRRTKAEIEADQADEPDVADQVDEGDQAAFDETE